MVNHLRPFLTACMLVLLAFNGFGQELEKRFFLLSQNKIWEYRSLTGEIKPFVASDRVQQAMLSPDGKTIFYTESRIEDYPKWMGGNGIASRMYKVDVATGTVTLVRGPVKTGLDKIKQDSPDERYASIVASMLGIGLFDWMDEETIIFAQRNIFSYNARTGVTVQLDTKLKLLPDNAPLAVVIYGVTWGEKYARIRYTSFNDLMAMSGGWSEDIFRVKDNQLYGDPILGGGGATYEFIESIRDFADGDTAIIYQDMMGTNYTDPHTYKIGFWKLPQEYPEPDITFKRQVPINIRDGEIITLDNPFSAEEEPGVYRVTGPGKAEKLQELPKLPFERTGEYQWNWEYDNESRLLYGAAKLSSEAVAYTYDFAAQKLTMVWNREYVPGVLRFLKGIVMTPAAARPVPRIASPPLVKTLSGRDTRVYSLAFSPDGKALAVGCDSLEVWDLKSGQRRDFSAGSHDIDVYVAFAPDGKSLVSGFLSLRFWNAADGELIKEIFLKDVDYTMHTLAFSPDGKTVAVGNVDLHLVDASGKTPARELRQKNHVEALAFSPEGKTLAVGFSERFDEEFSEYASDPLILMNPATGQRMKTLDGHAGDVTSIAWSRDGKTLLTGSADCAVKLWDVAKAQTRLTLVGHGAAVLSVAFSPDGKIAASGSADKTVKLWDAATGKLIATIAGHEDVVSSVAFSPDGRILATGSCDTTVKLWDVSGLAAGKKNP